MSETELAVDGSCVRVPETATTAEAAAMTAALGAYLRDRQAAMAKAGETQSPAWEGRRFAFAGRLEGVGDEPRRVPDGAPTDDWSAAGRTDRY